MITSGSNYYLMLTIIIISVNFLLLCCSSSLSLLETSNIPFVTATASSSNSSTTTTATSISLSTTSETTTSTILVSTTTATETATTASASPPAPSSTSSTTTPSPSNNNNHTHHGSNHTKHPQVDDQKTMIIVAVVFGCISSVIGIAVIVVKRKHDAEVFAQAELAARLEAGGGKYKPMVDSRCEMQTENGEV